MGCRESAQSGPSLAGFSFQESLGAGSYGQVRACTELATNKQVAVKIVHLSRKKRMFESKTSTHRNGTVSNMALMEASLWKRCSGHKHILSLFSSFITDAFAFFIMERCSCSLLDAFISLQPLDVDLPSFYRQMLLAVEHVHSRDIIHRDIKHANFLIKDNNILQLCDFGLAIDRFTSRKPAGSRLFMAPEMLQGGTYDCGVDIWSLGVTIYVIAFGDFPYTVSSGQDYKMLDFAITNNDPAPSFSAGLDFPNPSSATMAFVKQLLEHDPERRKTAKQCLKLEPVAKKARSWVLGPSLSRTTLSSASMSMRSARSASLCTSTLSRPSCSQVSMESGRSCAQSATFLSKESSHSIASTSSMAATWVELRKKARDLDEEVDQETQNDIDDVLKSMDPSAPPLDLKGHAPDAGMDLIPLPTLGAISENSLESCSDDPRRGESKNTSLSYELDQDDVCIEGLPALQPLLTFRKPKAASLLRHP